MLTFLRYSFSISFPFPLQYGYYPTMSNCSINPPGALPPVFGSMVLHFAYSLMHRLSDLIQNNDLQNIHFTDFNLNLREQYPSMFLFSILHSVNLSTEIVIARNQFYKGLFVSAIQTIESVAEFDSNPSFLFLWGYSYYMVSLFFIYISSFSSPYNNKSCCPITKLFRSPSYFRLPNFILMIYIQFVLVWITIVQNTINH